MNIRLQKYKKNRLKGMNQYNSARAAGYSESYSRKHNDKIERATKSDMADMLEQVGLTDKFLSNYLKKGLNAKKLYGKKGIKFADWGARHRFVETILKMAGKLKTSDVEINTGDVVNNVRNEIVYMFSGSRKEVEANAREREKEVQGLHDGQSAGGNRISQEV